MTLSTFEQSPANLILTGLVVALNIGVAVWLILKAVRHLRRYKLANAHVRITLVWWILTLCLCIVGSALQQVPEFGTGALGVVGLIMFVSEALAIGHSILLFDTDFTPSTRRSS